MEKQIPVNKPNKFSANAVSDSKVKRIFEYYTGLTYARFLLLATFLFPQAGVNPVKYKQKKKKKCWVCCWLISCS